MKEIAAYQTSDNQIFDNKLDAEKHELFLKDKEVIESFLNSPVNLYRSISQRSIVRSSILCWELWKVKNGK